MTVMGAKAQLSCATLQQDQAIRTNHQQVNFNTVGIAFLGETGAPNPASTAIQVDLEKAVAESITLLDVLEQPMQGHCEIQGAFTMPRGNCQKACI